MKGHLGAVAASKKLLWTCRSFASIARTEHMIDLTLWLCFRLSASSLSYRFNVSGRIVLPRHVVVRLHRAAAGGRHVSHVIMDISPSAYILRIPALDVLR